VRYKGEMVIGHLSKEGRVGREPTDMKPQAELLKVLAHPFRLRLLEELAKEEECVCHLSALFERPQPYISQQLAALRDADLLLDRRDGQRVFYRLADERVLILINLARELTGSAAQPLGPRRIVPNCSCPKCG